MTTGREAFDGAIRRKRQAERSPADPAGYLKQLLLWAEHNQSMRPEYLFSSYRRRIQAQTSTPQALRDEYLEKLRVLCDQRASTN